MLHAIFDMRGARTRTAMDFRARALRAGSALALAAMLPGAAMAQTTAPASPPAADASAGSQAAQPSTAGNPAGSGDIIVTALKRSESALKVPAAIQVLGGNDLRTVGVNSVSDLQNLVTGVTIGAGSFGTNVSIRGVTSTDETSKGELGVAFNIDGAFIGRGQEQGVAFFDLDRVEVLKGPQGTLYGRSSTGGAINVISKTPEIGVLGGFINVEYGNYNTKRATAALNIPVSDTLALRVAGNFNDRDGYLKPVDTVVTGSATAPGGSSFALSGRGLPAKNDQHDRTGRFSLLFKPSPDVTFRGVATVGHIGGAGQTSALDDNLVQGGSTQFDVIPNYVPSFVDENFTNFNEQLNWKFGAVQLDVLGNEQHFSDHSQTTQNNNPFDTGANPDGSSPPAVFLLDDYQGVFNTTQFEARLSNTATGRLDYVVGANYYHEHVHESDHNWDAPVATYNDVTTWFNGIDPVNVTQHTSYGFFAQATLHATSKLSVIGGVRYTHDDSNRVGTFATPHEACVNAAGVAQVYPADCIGGPNNGDAPDHKVTWKAGINYQLTPANLIYASVSTGFKAGGFNDFDPATGTTKAYKPEQLTAYELGFKGRPAKGLTFTSDLFYYDYSADQINGLVVFPGAGGVLYTQVVPTEIYGWENELKYQLNRDTTLNVAVAYNHTRIVSLKTGFLGALTGAYANFHDYALPNTPQWTLDLGATRKFELGNGAQVRARVFSKISAFYWLNDYANAVQFKQPSFTRTDASVTYATQGDRLTVQLFIENIENGLQRTAGPNNYNGTYGGFDGAVAAPEAAGSVYPTQGLNFGVTTPRFFGVRLGAKF